MAFVHAMKINKILYCFIVPFISRKFPYGATLDTGMIRPGHLYPVRFAGNWTQNPLLPKSQRFRFLAYNIN
jgi:hypothetical protein